LSHASPNMKLVAAILAIAASGLAAIGATLNPARRAQEAQINEASYDALARETRITRSVDAPIREHTSFGRGALEVLSNHLNLLSGVEHRDSLYTGWLSQHPEDSEAQKPSS